MQKKVREKVMEVFEYFIIRPKRKYITREARAGTLPHPKEKTTAACGVVLRIVESITSKIF